MSKTSTQETFLAIPHYLLKSPKFSATEKLFLTYILSWQREGKQCTASNQRIADDLGVDLSTLKRMVNKLNRTTFYKSLPESSNTKNGGHFNKSTKVVFEAALKGYISQEKPVKKKRDIILPVEQEAQETPEMVPQEELTLTVSETGQLTEQPNQKLDDMQRNQAFYALSNVIVEMEENIVEMTDDDALAAIQSALLSDKKLSQQTLMYCNRWLSVFIAEDYQEYKAYMNKSRVNQPATPVVELDEIYIP